MVFRCFAEKRPGADVEAAGAFCDIRENLGITALAAVRILHRYDAEGIDDALWKKARESVFAEPQIDLCFDELPEIPEPHRILAVESLPGQFDQRADSAAQCIQILRCGARPEIAYAKIYVLIGELSDSETEKIRKHLINPVESREAELAKPSTLARTYPSPLPVADVEGFISAVEARLEEIRKEYGLAMDMGDLQFMRSYFAVMEKRDPTVTELKVIDTYWSDHCRHTTFETHIDSVRIEDDEVRRAYEAYLSARQEIYGEKSGARPQTLMDIATIGAKVLKKRGLLKNLDSSEEVNACSIRVKADVDGKAEDWLIMFKNETHNHPTEIEPFGGAATCIGGAIRDPLSGRSYVYQAMRVTGAGDPRDPVEETIPGKLPQRKLTTTAALGYSSYGNQIGLATGLVHEFYHPGYVAKRMEVGAVIGAAPAVNVIRETPAPGDKIILVGGRTGRDGCGGATGSSKTHDLKSLTECAAEVQKGNAPEERKIQRLFRKQSVSRLIKRCNDFGAGGVSVAIGELADGLDIDLGLVRKKYDGLDGTELAISESQERMAVVVSDFDAAAFIREAESENLEAYVVASVTEEKRMKMRLDGRVIVDLSREFLSSNGADRHTDIQVDRLSEVSPLPQTGGADARMRALVSDLRFCSQRGLGERFDGTIGAGSVLAPYGGESQLTPSQSMAALLPVLHGKTTTASVMSFGFDPYASEQNTFEGARCAVITSVAKLVAAGCDPSDAYLSFQEYFERLYQDPSRWGKPFSALLGALDAQLGLGTAAIGGKDSMSGSFMELDVPPTLISFAVAPCEAEVILSPEFKAAGSYVYLFTSEEKYDKLREIWQKIRSYAKLGALRSAWALTEGGAAEGIFKMALGNSIGVKCADSLDIETLFGRYPGAILVESAGELEDAVLIGRTSENPVLEIGGEKLELDTLRALWEKTLEGVFPTTAGETGEVLAISSEKRSALSPAIKTKKPRALIPAFPGTNCEEDTARAVRRVGGEAEIAVIRNLTPALLQESVEAFARAIGDSHMIIIPGGFSGGDEPEGSAKFIASFFRNPRIADAVHELLYKRDGLVLGICNGFQALIKLGLLPFGEIRPMTDECPTLTFNRIGRHQSGYVTTRVASSNSPWMNLMSVGDLHTVPVSHGEGRFVAGDETIRRLIRNGQVATQYTDRLGVPSMDISVNPNGSLMAIEGILSPDGKILGKMAHTERAGEFVGKNIYGNLHQPIFESGIEYFK